MNSEKLSLPEGMPDSGMPDLAAPETRELAGSNSGPKRSDFRRFLLWWLLFALVIGFLGFLFDRLLVKFNEAWWDDWLKNRRTQTADLLANIQGEMQLKPVLLRVMRGFTRDVKETRITPETPGRLESLLKRKIPHNTQCYWFDENLSLDSMASGPG